MLAQVGKKLVPIPINLDTVNRLYDLDLTPDQLERFFSDRAENITDVRTSEDAVVSRVGRDFTRKCSAAIRASNGV